MSTRSAVFTTTHQERVRIAVTVIESLSLATNIFILSASCWIWSVKAARHHIQRVSYKIILWAVVSQSWYNFIRLILYTNDDTSSFITDRPGLCTAGMYFFLKELHVTNFLITCIAINLMLIVCYGVNPIEQRLLRWYVGGSVALGAFIPLIPAALGHFGPDPLYKLCYLTAFDVDQRMRAVVLDVVLWELLSCLVASVCVIAVLITLFKQGRSTAQALMRGNPINAHLHSNSDSTLVSEKGCQFNARLLSWRSWGGRRSSDDTESDKKSGLSNESNNHLHDKFLGIALKISLYPIILIIANVVLCAADIYFNLVMRDGMNTVSQVGFLTVYQILYAGRGFCFATLCIFVDPSFRKGITAAWNAKRNARMAKHGQPQMGEIGQSSSHGGGEGPGGGNRISFGQFLTSQIEPILIKPLDSQIPDPTTNTSSDIDVDISSALIVLPYTPGSVLPPLPSPAESIPDPIDNNKNVKSTLLPPSITTPPRRFTRVFTGVTSDSLPIGLSDGVDVDLRLSYESPTRFARPRDIAAVQGMRTLGAVALSNMIEDESKEYGLEGTGTAYVPEEELHLTLDQIGAEREKEALPSLTFDQVQVPVNEMGDDQTERRIISSGVRRRSHWVIASGSGSSSDAQKRFEEIEAML